MLKETEQLYDLEAITDWTGPESPRAKIIRLTPELAQQFLDRNPNNRNISAPGYGKILRAVKEDQWELNGESIKIDRKGYMSDGQHRCKVVVDTGIPILTFLIYNLEPRVVETMDMGVSRSLGHVLQQRGEERATDLASTLSWDINYTRQGLEKALGQGRAPTTVQDALKHLEENPDVRDLTINSSRIVRHFRIPRPVIVMLMREFEKVDKSDADFFWNQVYDKYITEDDPISTLKTVINNIKKNNDKGSRDAYKTNERTMTALVIKAWNKYRLGESCSRLYFRPGGASPEVFPTAI